VFLGVNIVHTVARVRVRPFCFEVTLCAPEDVKIKILVFLGVNIVHTVDWVRCCRWVPSLSCPCAPSSGLHRTAFFHLSLTRSWAQQRKSWTNQFPGSERDAEVRGVLWGCFIPVCALPLPFWVNSLCLSVCLSVFFSLKFSALQWALFFSIFVCLGEFVQEIVGLVFCQPSFQQGILICFWCYLVSSSELSLICTCLIVLSCLFQVQEVWCAHWENLQQDPAGQIPVGCWHGNSWFPVLMTTSMLDAKTQSIRRVAWKERLSHFIWHWCFSYSNLVFYTKSTSADISGQFELQGCQETLKRSE